MNKPLHLPDIRSLSVALAADLQELSKSRIAIGFILKLREKMDKYIDQLDNSRLPSKKKTKIKRKIKVLSIPFHRFHNELYNYRQNGMK
ncbi:hypothetical protein [Paenibacillus harenae]|uniref:hypothetical protein n=1 Tax=Paenibacillus harenae TaxID=306543 RepID=UPI0027D84BF0|nr:hypothetical protein [Paenibacillus harenae]